VVRGHFLTSIVTSFPAADPRLGTLNSDELERHVVSGGTELKRRYRGDLLQRVICRSWFHTGENAAIQQEPDLSTNLPTGEGWYRIPDSG